MYSPREEFAQHEQQVLLQYPSQVTHLSKQSLQCLEYYMGIRFQEEEEEEKKISCINKTYISVISTCAVSRAAPSFRTCACWPTVMEHSDCCYKTLYHWFLSSPFPFVHLYSFDTRWHSLARRPVFPICNIFCKFTILTPTKRRASGGELRVSRRTRVECF